MVLLESHNLVADGKAHRANDVNGHFAEIQQTDKKLVCFRPDVPEVLRKVRPISASLPGVCYGVS